MSFSARSIARSPSASAVAARARTAIARLLAAVLLAPAALASTWIVDQAGGPGHHFTDLPQAIAAAAPGDVLIVRPGDYSSFVLEKGLSILGESFTTTHVRWQVGTGPRIRNLPVGETAIITSLSFSSLSGSLQVADCDGAVVFDQVRAICYVTIAQCADVRLAGTASNRGLSVRDAHVEIVSSNLLGESQCCDGTPGSAALGVRGASRVLLARSSARGGDGGAGLPYFPGDGGNGAPAAWVYEFGELLIAGGGVATLQGGVGGQSGGFGGVNGSSSSALFNQASRDWRSGATFIGGNGVPPIQYVPGPGSFDVAVTPDDPTLELVGTAHAGSDVTLSVHAPSGSIVRVTLGGKPVVIAEPNVRVEQLTTRDRSIFLGVVPASGVVSHVLHVPASYPIGARLFAQARVVDYAIGEVRRTNSVPIIVR